MKIYIGIDVPDDWKFRLDMQRIVEGEVKADRWSLHRAIPSPVNAQLLEALRDFLDCQYEIDPATVSKAGLEATMRASPYQVVANMSVALQRIRNARAAIAEAEAEEKP
jgi:hypothetical protein